MSLDEVLAEVGRCGCPLVELTGGEPLLQKEAVPLMARLLAAGHTVLLETGGHLSIADVPRAVVKIVDVKCPGSGEAARRCTGRTSIVLRAARRGEVRHHGSRRLRVRARRRRAGIELAGRVAAVLFSPVHGVLDPQALAEWILEDRLPVRLQLQLHKYIWSARDAGRLSLRRRVAGPDARVVLLSGGLDSYTAGGDRRAPRASR